METQAFKQMHGFIECNHPKTGREREEHIHLGDLDVEIDTCAKCARVVKEIVSVKVS